MFEVPGIRPHNLTKQRIDAPGMLGKRQLEWNCARRCLILLLGMWCEFDASQEALDAHIDGDKI